MEHYIPVETMCKATRLLDDGRGLDEYMHQVFYLMNATTSLVAVDSTGVPRGVLIGKVEELDECSEKLIQNTTFTSKKLQTINNLLTFLTKAVNIYKKYNCKVYYRIYIIAVQKQWENKGIEKALITGALKVSSVMKIQTAAGAFSMYKDQYYMNQFESRTDFEVYFSEWKTDQGLQIFLGTGKTEPKICFMSVKVPESFKRSEDDLLPLSYPTSERARRFMKERLGIWEDLDIDRACECLEGDHPVSQKKKKWEIRKRPLPIADRETSET